MLAGLWLSPVRNCNVECSKLPMVCTVVVTGDVRDRIILFYMDNLTRLGGLFYIKVHEKKWREMLST